MLLLLFLEVRFSILLNVCVLVRRFRRFYRVLFFSEVLLICLYFWGLEILRNDMLELMLIRRYGYILFFGFMNCMGCFFE